IETSDAQIGGDHDDRHLDAAQHVAEVVVQRGDFRVAVAKFLVQRGQFFVGRLQLFLGGLQFLVGALQFLVAGKNLLAGRFEFLVGGVLLFDYRLQVVFGRDQVAPQLGNLAVFLIGGRGRGLRRRRCRRTSARRR